MIGVDGTASVFIKKGNLDMQISNVKSESRYSSIAVTVHY